MNTIKIYLAESGRIADLHKDFPLYQGQYQSKLLNVFVPTSILAPNFSAISSNTENIINEYVAGTAVKIGMRTVARNGEYKQSQNYYLRFLKTLVYQGVEYALYERKLPQEFTFYAGQGMNAPTLIINVVNIETNYRYEEDATVTATTEGVYYTYNSTTQVYTQVTLPEDFVEGTTYYKKIFDPKIISITTSQSCSLDVLPSTNLDKDEAIEPSELDSIIAQLDEINSTLPLKQNKVDENLDTTDKTVVGGINENKENIDTNTQNIETNTQDIATNRNDIDYLLENMAFPEEYIGQMEGEYLPTDTELTEFVEENTEPSREPKNADVIIFVLQIAGDTDKTYKYIYSSTGWNGYEIPPIESASNGSLGIIKGTYLIGSTNNTLVDISGGQILNIYVKDGANTYRNIREYLNTTTTNISNIVNGTTRVGVALMAIADGLGQTIVDTYLTKTAGATKTYVRDYALPKEFNDSYYITSDGYSKEIPDSQVQFEVTTDSIGDHTLFDLQFNNTAHFELSQNNGYINSIWYNIDAVCDIQFRLTTQYKKVGEVDWTDLYVELTPIINITSTPKLNKYDFSHAFSNLDGIAIALDDGDKIRQILEVVTDTSEEITFQILCGQAVQSTFNLTLSGIKVDTINVIDNLESTSPTDALSANQGRVLNNNIETLAEGLSDAEQSIQELENDIDAIEAKIPAQASSSNQLADKAFVNSTVQTATANFRGNWSNWASVPIDPTEYPADYAGVTTPSTNDYMVVQDASGYVGQTLVGTWRFKYTGIWSTDGRNGWQPEYQVNETPLTAAQLAALNSGITSSLVEQIGRNEQSIADLEGTKQDLIDSDNKLSSDLVDTTGKTNKFVTQAQIDAWNALKGGLLFDVGSAQFSFDGKVFPLITVTNARLIYASYKLANHCLIKWTLYGTENYLNVLSADLISGTYSMEILVHSEYIVTYTWTDATVGNVTYSVIKIPTLDNTPTFGSTNGVTSSGVYNALLKISTLWTNPNPTSEFSAQTITLSSSDWDYLLIYFHTNENLYSLIIPYNYISKNTNYAINGIANFSSGTWQNEMTYRIFKLLTDNSIQFNGGNRVLNGQYQHIADNNMCIPTCIIGIKDGE